MIRFREILAPDELRTLQQAFDQHCLDIGLPSDSPIRDNVASRILYLFQSGVTTFDDLMIALKSDRDM